LQEVAKKATNNNEMMVLDLIMVLKF